VRSAERVRINKGFLLLLSCAVIVIVLCFRLLSSHGTNNMKSASLSTFMYVFIHCAIIVLLCGKNGKGEFYPLFFTFSFLFIHSLFHSFPPLSRTFFLLRLLIIILILPYSSGSLSRVDYHLHAIVLACVYSHAHVLVLVTFIA
jgi:hypothetical protein